MVLFWLLIGLKFREFWYINHYVLKKKVFYLIRGEDLWRHEAIAGFPQGLVRYMGAQNFLMCPRVLKPFKNIGPLNVVTAAPYVTQL